MFAGYVLGGIGNGVGFVRGDLFGIQHPHCNHHSLRKVTTRSSHHFSFNHKTKVLATQKRKIPQIGIYTKFDASWTKREVAIFAKEVVTNKLAACLSTISPKWPPSGATTTTSTTTTKQTTTQRAPAAQCRHRPRGDSLIRSRIPSLWRSQIPPHTGIRVRTGVNKLIFRSFGQKPLSRPESASSTLYTKMCLTFFAPQFVVTTKMIERGK